MKTRTARINDTRGRLHEYGIIVPQGAATVRTHVLEKWATEDTKLTPLSRELVRQLRRRWERGSPGGDLRCAGGPSGPGASRGSAAADDSGAWGAERHRLGSSRE